MANLQQKLRFARQRALADWLRAMGLAVDDFEIQLRVFQLMADSLDKFYEFSPTKDGPFSFQLEADLPIVRSYLDSYSESQTTHLEFEDKDKLLEVASSVTLKKIMDQQPFFGINSTREEAHTPKVLAEKEAIEKKRKEAPVIFTVGYEGRSLEGFLNTLLSQGVIAIADVRAVSFSYKFGFGGSFLKRSAEAVGLGYRQFPELGIASQIRSKFKNPKQRPQMFSQYRDSLCDKEDQLRSLAEFASVNRRVALLCFEKDVGNCHRQHVRNWLRTNLNYPSVDL